MEVKKSVDAIVAHNCSVRVDWVVMHGRGEGGPVRCRVRHRHGHGSEDK
jgi:hypothetical protein